MGGDRGGGKKGGKREKEGVKKPPLPQSGLLRGTRLGSLKKSFPREEKFHSSLVPGRPDLAGRNPTGSTGTGLCPCSGSSSRLPSLWGQYLLPSLSGQLREVSSPPAM
jgi:hypothetical protein